MPSSALGLKSLGADQPAVSQNILKFLAIKKLEEATVMENEYETFCHFAK